MRKPIIGIVLLVDIERKSYWMLPGYMKGIKQAGGIPLMIPLTSNEENLQQLADEIDGFLYTGG
jgi:putative glutamine amidotransferase